jgi:hypothetical protein
MPTASAPFVRAKLGGADPQQFDLVECNRREF